MRREDREVVRRERDAVDPDQAAGDRPGAGIDLQRLEVPVRRVVDALGQMQNQLLRTGDSRQELVGGAGLDVGDVRCGRSQLRVARRLDVADEPAVMGHDARRRSKRDALARRGPAEQAPHLDVAHHRGHDVGVAAEHAHRAGDQTVVVRGRRAAPLVPVAEFLRHLPERQHVIWQVVMQFDKSRTYRAASCFTGHLLISRWGRRSRREHGGNRTVSCIDDTVVQYGALIIHCHYPAAECYWRTDRRIERRSLHGAPHRLPGPQRQGNGPRTADATRQDGFPQWGQGEFRCPFARTCHPYRYSMQPLARFGMRFTPAIGQTSAAFGEAMTMRKRPLVSGGA